MIFSTGCDSGRVENRNPYVPSFSFAIDINMELPMYNALLYPSNAQLITLNGAGANGIIVFNTGTGYRAYEANCPNQYILNCSQLQISGVRAKCPCDDYEYSLFTGLPVAAGDYAMIPYRVERVGNILRVSN